MPEDMIKLLVNLDAGKGNGPWEPPTRDGDGPVGATTKVYTAQGRSTGPARHGRGVRQGSVGGPIKWIAFMNMWIAWIKKEMKGLVVCLLFAALLFVFSRPIVVGCSWSRLLLVMGMPSLVSLLHLCHTLAVLAMLVLPSVCLGGHLA